MAGGLGVVAARSAWSGWARRARLDVHGRYVELSGQGRMYVREARGPRRSRTLVLLHGLGATAALNWDGCIPTLARRFHVLAPDHRGHGRGMRCGGRFRLEECADDVAALLRQETRAPALIVGYSMGGPIAQLLCRRHPELVAGMILCATSRDFRGRRSERIPFHLLAAAALASRLAPSVGRPANDRRGDLDRGRGVLGELAGHERRAILAAAASLGSFTSRDWVGDLTAPAAVVATTRDHLVPPRRQFKLAASLDAPVVELDAGHFVAHSDPDALAGAILTAADHLPRRAFRRRRRAA